MDKTTEDKVPEKDMTKTQKRRERRKRQEELEREKEKQKKVEESESESEEEEEDSDESESDDDSDESESEADYIDLTENPLYQVLSALLETRGGDNIADILIGIRESIDKHTKTMTKLLKEFNKKK